MTRAEYAVWWEAYELACAEETDRVIDYQDAEHVHHDYEPRD